MARGWRVVGIGHQGRPRGMRSGNTSSTWRPPRRAPSPFSGVDSRGDGAGEHVREVIVGVSGGSAALGIIRASTSRSAITRSGERDVRRVQTHIHLPAEDPPTATLSIRRRSATRSMARPVRDAARHVRRAAWGVDVQSGHGGGAVRCAKPCRSGVPPRPSRDRRAGVVAAPRPRGLKLAGLRRARPSVVTLNRHGRRARPRSPSSTRANLVHVDHHSRSAASTSPPRTHPPRRACRTPLAHCPTAMKTPDRPCRGQGPTTSYDIIDVAADRRGGISHAAQTISPRSILVGIIRPADRGDVRSWCANRLEGQRWWISWPAVARSSSAGACPAPTAYLKSRAGHPQTRKSAIGGPLAIGGGWRIPRVARPSRLPRACSAFAHATIMCRRPRHKPVATGGTIRTNWDGLAVGLGKNF